MVQNTATIIVLGTKLSAAYQTIKELMRQLQQVEANIQIPANQRLEEIKKIKAELDKVGEEIDSIKREITLLNAYRIN